MSDARGVIGELRHDFVERNTALFLLLGIVSAGKRLERALAESAPLHDSASNDHGPAVTNLDYLTLGLIAVTERVAAMAARFAEGVPEPEAGGAPPHVGGDLLR